MPFACQETHTVIFQQLKIAPLVCIYLQPYYYAERKFTHKKGIIPKLRENITWMSKVASLFTGPAPALYSMTCYREGDASHVLGYVLLLNAEEQGPVRELASVGFTP